MIPSTASGSRPAAAISKATQDYRMDQARQVQYGKGIRGGVRVSAGRRALGRADLAEQAWAEQAWAEQAWAEWP